MIEVSCQSFYLAQHSQPEAKRYLFAYEIVIRNQGNERVQLLSRHWIITDSHHQVEEVRGDGVIGQQPIILPGEEFRYSSGCPLSTPVGTMRGTYTMQKQDGSLLQVPIPEFVLSIPRTLH
ncbi:MAG: Co2+/Mg2+ efflux protein ApaG [Pseudomonadota bacterium]|jgi:ApaG protein